MTHENGSIAVLIPVLNEEPRIAEVLGRLCAMDFLEIIAADGGSTDNTVEIIRSFPAVTVVTHGGSRGSQLNAAAEVATSEILVIVHADTWLPANAPILIRQTLNAPDVAAGCFRLKFDQDHLALKVYAWLSRIESRLTTFGDQCIFTRRATFLAAGGAPDWPLLEDVELRRRLRRCGRFIKRSEAVVTSARRFTKHGVVRQQLRNAAV
ncbi:MAG: TIGR04283 family arsenosugar biosynthesis glycosyltransferase, partial [Hyphomicrobiaceae bacterium]|nr:TIGR04283 family arsenosugar biosynthesis glycosyltransferase [Hyphomicrobiaceae bacterium]